MRMNERRRDDEPTTEKVNPRTAEIDKRSTAGVLELILAEDSTICDAVGRELNNIERAVELIISRLREGGRLFFVGAGTSGRLGVGEAAECPPTFGTGRELVQGIIAGGRKALWRSVEGAEDAGEDGAEQLEARGLSGADCVVGIAASSTTPFVKGALARAGDKGAGTVLVTCNPAPAVAADVVVSLLVGPEVIVGSTRMKAGTATKMVLNMLSTASMVRLGKTYGNLMVEVGPHSEKLRRRQERIVVQLLGVDSESAVELLSESGRDVKLAVLMGRLNLSRAAAKRLLDESGGFLRKALGEGGREG